MKTVLYLILIIFLLQFTLPVSTYFAAKLSSVQTVSKINKDSIIGIWELRSTSSGNIFPISLPAGNGNLIKFSNSDYELYSQGQLTLKGNYVLSKYNAESNTLSYDHGAVSKDIEKTDNGKLILISTNSDFATRIYERVE